MATYFAECVIRFRWFIIALSLLLVGIAAYGGKSLTFSTEYRDFFAEGNPQLQAFESMQNIYDKSDNVMLVVTPKDGQSVFTPQTLSSLQWLTEQAWQVPYSTRVDSITNYQHTEAIDDDLNVADLVTNPLSLDAAQLRRLQDIAINEPLLRNRLISEDATVTGVNINLQLPGESIEETPEIAAFVRDLAQQLRSRDSNLDVRLTGIVMMNNAFAESAQRDMATLIPLMFLVVIGLLWILLRSITGTLATVALIFMSIAAAMGLFGWSGAKLTPPSASAPTIILTMAVADAVHLLVSFLWSMRHGLTKEHAMIESIRINLVPIFLTSVTTIVGFLSMNFSEVPPLAHMGNIVAAGVAIAFVLSITFLPALVMVLPVKVRSASADSHPWLDKLAGVVISRRRPLMTGMLLISAIFIAFIPQNEFNDEFVKYFGESLSFRQDTDYASANLVGPYTIEYSFEASSVSGIAEPEYLQEVQMFVEHLYTYPDVAHVYTLTDTMKRLNKNMHGDIESQYALPENRELAAQYLLLYELSLPYGLDLNNQIDINKRATRITMTTQNLSSNQVLALEQSIDHWLSTNATGYQVTAASPALMFAHIGYRNARSLMFGTALTLVAISLILVVALRSLRIGIISLIPNLVPAGIAFGIWGMIDGQIGMSVSIVAGMTLGIVVDDTVHFLSKYLRARREKGYDAADATRYAFTHVGQALVVTSSVLVVGFLVLAISTFKLNADMGLVTALTIGIALLVDFLLLPPLLMAFDRNATTGASSPAILNTLTKPTLSDTHIA